MDYTSTNWWAIIDTTNGVPFQLFASESVARDVLDDMHWADEKETAVKKVTVVISYE